MTKYQIFITADHMVRVEGDDLQFDTGGGVTVIADGKLVATFASYLYVLTGE